MSSDYAKLAGIYFFYFLVYFAICGIFGLITKKINTDKGYDGGFGWGFWLGAIGIIVVACRQDNFYYKALKESIARNSPSSVNDVSTDGWKCSCGRVHAGYVSSCACGQSKINMLQHANAVSNAKADSNATTKNLSAIREYKKLLDDGIITQEEYDAKKKQLLGL